MTRLFPSLNEHTTHHQITLAPFHKPRDSHVYFAPEYSQTKDLSHQRQVIPKQVYFFNQSRGEEIEEESTSLLLTELFTDSSTCCLVSIRYESMHKAANGYELFVSCEKAHDVWNVLTNNRVLPVGR